MRLNVTGHKSREFERLAMAVQRKRLKGGSEPYWGRESAPALPPLAIPHHSAVISPGVARVIINELINDCDTWNLHLLENES